MLAPTHMTGGAVAAMAYTAIVAPDMPLHLTLCAGAVGAIAALIPDIDHANSTISNKLKPISILVCLICSKRGLFHTVFLYLALWIVWLINCPQEWMHFWAILTFIGILSHLVLDIITPDGIPLFFPFEFRHRRIIGIEDGGAMELVIRVILMACCFGMIGQQIA